VFVDILPHTLIVCIENVRAVTMYHNSGFRLPFGMAISADVIALVINFDMAIEVLDELPRKNSPGKTGTNNQKRFWHMLNGKMKAKS